MKTIIALTVGLALLGGYHAFAPAPQNDILTPHLIIENLIIPVELARTPHEISTGLSHRPSLAPEKGMLFIFKHPALYRFWMPDMNFPLDMVWIAGNTIIDISHDVPNNFNPAQPKLYKPRKPADRVLEMNAGFAQKHSLHIGDTVLFKYTEN